MGGENERTGREGEKKGGKGGKMERESDKIGERECRGEWVSKHHPGGERQNEKRGGGGEKMGAVNEKNTGAIGNGDHERS